MSTQCNDLYETSVAQGARMWFLSSVPHSMMLQGICLAERRITERANVRLMATMHNSFMSR